MFRPVKIRHYVAFMEARGHAAPEVLAGSGLDAEQLQNPACLVDLHQYQAVVANMIRLSGNQGIGFEIGAEAEIADFGIVGHGMMSSRTARDALALWMRYSNSLVGTLLTLELHEHGKGAWSLRIAELRPMGFVYNFVVEEILMIARTIGAALTKKPFIPAAVELSYPAPAHQALYAQQLLCEAHFNCRQTRIRFDEAHLDLPVRGFDEEFNLICLQHCKQIMRQISADSPLASRIRNLLLAKGAGIPGLSAIARELGTSDRTLRRQLQEEGISYKALVNELRKDLAREYLKTSRLTAKETAYLLGFKDTNAFRRAFKVWTGQTIHEFREQVDAE